MKTVICGVGSGGINCLDSIIGQLNQEFTSIAIGRDVNILNNSKANIKIILPAVKSDKSEIKKAKPYLTSLAPIFLETKKLIVISCLGGMTGSFFAGEVARIGKENGGHIIAIVTLPFDFESEDRTQNCEVGIKLLRDHVDELTFLPNQELIQSATKNETMYLSLRKIDTFAIKFIEKIICDQSELLIR